MKQRAPFDRLPSPGFAAWLFLALVVAPLRAESAAASAPFSQAELEALARAMMPAWLATGNVHATVGWNSNVLFGARNPERSGFARADWEASAWRQPRGSLPAEFILMASGSQTRYFSAPEQPNATEAFAAAETRWSLSRLPLRLALSAQGYFLDTVLDLSTETDPLVARIRTAGAIAGGAARWKIRESLWLEGGAAIHRSDFRDVPQDFGERRFRGQAGWERGPWGISANYSERQRAYAERNRTTASGRALAGTRLHYRLRDAELRVVRKASWHGEWEAALLLAGGANRDDGAGYFDYTMRRLGPELRWKTQAWKLEIGSDARRYEWSVQTVGVGIDPPRRVRDNFGVRALLERKLGARWLAQLRAEWDRARSNDPDYSYRAVRFSTGAGASF